MNHNPELLRLSRQMAKEALRNLKRNHFDDGNGETGCEFCDKAARLKAEIKCMDRLARQARVPA